MLKKRLANPFAAKLGSHKQVFHKQAGAARPRRISEEIERVCCRLAVPLCNRREEPWIGSKTVAQQVLRSGINLFQFMLEIGEFTNHIHD